MIRATTICTVLSAAASIAAAEAPVLQLPLDCTLGETCYIEDYVDTDPTQGRQQDFACGINSRDGHKGTDFALLSFDAISQGVTVRAAADGRVLRVRDEMPDDRLMRGVTSQNACGNAALVDHGDGWQTLYCHMRLGSVSVQPGDTVTAGDPLGLVGLSGQTNHPHVHVTVYHDGNVVDPFDPEGDPTCGQPDQGLWDDAPEYYKTGLITAGFSDAVPTLEDVRSGTARRDTVKPSVPLVVFAHLGYAQTGDVLDISAQGPDGQVFNRTMLLRDPQVSLMRAFGKKAPPQGWAKGDYLGEATLTRNGTIIAHRFAHVTVE